MIVRKVSYLEKVNINIYVIEFEYMDDFDKYNKMKADLNDTKDDFDFNLEIPDDYEDYEMQTPVKDFNLDNESDDLGF
mgnify:CR=1 FL=1